MAIIRNYGLFWERDKVNWGSRGLGNRGTLEGYCHDPDEAVDFRRQAGVYILYEGVSIPSQRVTYIGQAGRGGRNLFSRLKEHLNDHLWNRWQRFSWFGVYDVGRANTLVHAKSDKNVKLPVSEILNQLEGALLLALEPLLNKQGPRWKDATEYFQTHEYGTTLNDLDERLDAIEEELKRRSR